ncbi:MAG: hypothetical protein HQ518_06245 [Rhodopirellula sp.]|nr:hypothetical protein [Rhodopirellula sp.]
MLMPIPESAKLMANPIRKSLPGGNDVPGVQESVNGNPQPRRRVSRSKLNFALDIALAMSFVVLCAVAAIVQIVFPPPSVAAGWTVFGGTIDQWITLQFGCLCVLAGGIILHVMLHWSWVCGMLTRGRPDTALRTDDGVRTIVGVGFLIVLLHFIGFAVLIAILTVHSP